jgi:hypothetical protein
MPLKTKIHKSTRRGGGPSVSLMAATAPTRSLRQVQERQDIKVVELDQDPWIYKKRREFRGIWDQDEVRVPLTAYLCDWSTGDVVED